MKYIFFITIIKILFLLIILNNYKIKKIIFHQYYKYYLNEQKTYFKKYFNLKDLSLNNNKSLINEEKKNILNLFYQKNEKKNKYIKTIFYSNDNKFGNLLINLNKLIFYCQIIGCNNIILDKQYFWFLKNKIYIKKYNISIEVKSKRRIKTKKILFYNSSYIFYTFFRIKPEIRINYLSNEIIKNLPIYKSSIDYLYIHIRSGDIFKRKPHILYTQPPLCFYQSILENYKFKKIYLISKDNKNPIIQKLISEYPNIIINKRNSFKDDICY